MRTFFFVAMALCLDAAFAGGRMDAGNDSLNLLEGDYTITEFRFTNGEKLSELRIHYRTVGKPAVVSGEIQNAILMLHGTSSTGGAFLADGFRSAMFGPGQALDARKYYLILPDSIGLGGSSKPSDGLRARFPRYGSFARRIREEVDIRTGAVGLITEPRYADEIITGGDANLVFIAREMLREPYWALKAQQMLGQDSAWPIQYGYALKRRAK